MERSIFRLMGGEVVVMNLHFDKFHPGRGGSSSLTSAFAHDWSGRATFVAQGQLPGTVHVTTVT